MPSKTFTLLNNKLVKSAITEYKNYLNKEHFFKTAGSS